MTHDDPDAIDVPGPGFNVHRTGDDWPEHRAKARRNHRHRLERAREAAGHDLGPGRRHR